MDASTIIIVVLWLWGAYKGWNTLTGKNEWLDRKEPINCIVKGAICVLFGGIFMLWMLIKFVMKLFGLSIGM